MPSLYDSEHLQQEIPANIGDYSTLNENVAWVSPREASILQQRLGDRTPTEAAAMGRDSRETCESRSMSRTGVELEIAAGSVTLPMQRFSEAGQRKRPVNHGMSKIWGG